MTNKKALASARRKAQKLTVKGLPSLREQLDAGQDFWIGPSLKLSDKLRNKSSIRLYHGTDAETAEKIRGWQDLRPGTYLSFARGSVDPAGNGGALGYAQNRQYHRLGKKRGGVVLEFDIPLDAVALHPTTGEFILLK